MSTTPPSTATRPAKPLPPPGVAPTRLWLAASRADLAVLMLVTVILLNMSIPNSPKVGSTPKLEKVSGLTASANPFARSLVIAGEPVPDILDAVVVPAGAAQLAGPPRSVARRPASTAPSSSVACLRTVPLLLLPRRDEGERLADLLDRPARRRTRRASSCSPRRPAPTAGSGSRA